MNPSGRPRPGSAPRAPRATARGPSRRLPVLVLLAAAAAPACTYSQSNVVRPGELSPTLAPMVFKEEGALILMTVGVNATRFHGDDAFIPLEVWIANKGIEPYIRITRESLFLMDTFGRRYGMASVDEVRRLQRGLSMDRQMSTGDFNALKFGGYRFVESSFFPVLGASILLDRVEVPKYGFMRDILYFPRPDGDLVGGIFELHLATKELPQEIFVVFEVPR